MLSVSPFGLFRPLACSRKEGNEVLPAHIHALSFSLMLSVLGFDPFQTIMLFCVQCSWCIGFPLDRQSGFLDVLNSAMF